MIYPLRADERNCKPLVMRRGDAPDKLCEYSYVPWNGEYYIRTGWGQEAGRVRNEREARLFCDYARACMTFDGRTIHMSKTLDEWMDEHEKVLAMNQHKDAAEAWGCTIQEAWRIMHEAYKAKRLPLWMTRGEWRRWVKENNPTVIAADMWREVAERWGMREDVVKDILLVEVREGRLPRSMMRDAFNAWVEWKYETWYHKWDREGGLARGLNL